MINRPLLFAMTSGLFAMTAACGGSEDSAPSASQNAAPQNTASEASESAPAPVQAAQNASPGKKIFDTQCTYCHAPGDEHPGTMQLRVTRGEDFAVLEQRADLTPDYVKYIVRNGLNGMAPFTPTTITDAELDQLAAYLAKTE